MAYWDNRGKVIKDAKSIFQWRFHGRCRCQIVRFLLNHTRSPPSSYSTILYLRKILGLSRLRYSLSQQLKRFLLSRIENRKESLFTLFAVHWKKDFFNRTIFSILASKNTAQRVRVWRVKQNFQLKFQQKSNLLRGYKRTRNNRIDTVWTLQY